ncbi:hypothetical protein C7974DRAFT_56893 [Boeremia exigua]|uniref:uncharacterized protein n=1 Tax=Boeremia exigua TaxID=749465 RepID=UPI001E8E15CD|nr:uncharacterized protein C7974DRAFT_56893 [Boeremia exigua]KAH6614978.1 hypothetical protein C7974DRAFT_56893 [Boeremia exigua]
MPPTLHPYLKRGLDFDTSPPGPSDLVEDSADYKDDAEYNAAKRRRVEAIALQYLRGRPPLILTARLKGPFTKEWRNPWTTDTSATSGRQSKRTVNRAGEQGGKKSRPAPVDSPEMSRAAGHTEEQPYTSTDLESLPATAPLPDEEDPSTATEFLSLNTGQIITHHSPANPFWLRRPAESIALPSHSQTDKSPIKTRTKDRRFNPREPLQLAPPKEPLAGQPLPIRATPPDAWRSSDSASMDISSPPKPAPIANQASEPDPSHATSSTDIPTSSRLRADSAQEEEARSSQTAQNAQAAVSAESPVNCNVASSGAHTVQPAYAQSFDSLVPATTYKVSSTIQVPRSSPRRSSAGAGGQDISPKGDMQVSAEGLASAMSTSGIRRQPAPNRRAIVKDLGLLQNSRHNLVASPAPASSTGFMYRKVGQPRGDSNDLPKTKPRAVSFSSSPIFTRKDHCHVAVDPEVDAPVDESRPECAMPRASIEAAVEGSGIEAQGDEEDQNRDEEQESYKSRQSQYSTQAAMLLAQLEFQEDSPQSSTSSATLRPWSQPAQNTPPPPQAQPSPAITPLSVFNVRTDISFNDLAVESVLHDAPISTQDLFDAASPFAFSTVKKKSQPRRTSLRFALTSKLNESTTANSPTPFSERRPLMEKNTRVMWSSNHEKSSLHPAKLASQSPKRTSNDVELPQLDFHTSLDFGPNTDFTDCFLKGLENAP